MNKEIITDKQKIAMMILFLTGSTSIYAPGLDAKKDSWIAVILAFIMTLPMIFVYIRIHKLFPNKDLFDIVEICFGKYIGKTIILIFIFYTFYWASDVLNNYSKYIVSTSFLNTPEIVLIISIAFLSVCGLKNDFIVLGAWSQLFYLVPIVSLSVIVFLLITNVHISNIEPLFSEGFSPLFKGAFSVFSQPFTQISAFLLVFLNFEAKESPSKVYFQSFIVAAIYLCILTLMSILVLGEHLATRSYYPAYELAKEIHVGLILQRVEILVSISFVLGGFIKITVLILCACKGISKLFNCKDYRFIIIPIALMITNLGYFQYASVQDYMEFNSNIWPYFFFPFHIIIPLITLVFGQIQIHKRIKLD